ncbi:MAG: VWA domain-containing protein [Myxococcota bacterium]
MNALPAAVALALGVAASGVWLAWAIRRHGLARRHWLLLISVLALLPALSVLVAWARLYVTPFARFDRPILTLPCAAILLWLVTRLLQLSQRFSAARRSLLELTTGLAAYTASLAVSGLEIGHALDRLTVVIALDRSRSIDLVSGAERRFESERKLAELGMRDDDLIAVVAFGANAAVEEPPRPKSTLPAPQKADVARDGTDLGAGIRQALAEVPPDSAARIVMLSDGVRTRGDSSEAALAAAALGVPIDVVPLDQGRITDVRVIAVRATSRAAQGEAIDLRVVTQSSEEAEVEARVYRDGELIRSGPARLARGEDVLFLREVAPGPGLHRYDVELSARRPEQDRAPDDNAGSAFVRVRGPTTALVLDSDAALTAPLQRALSAAAFEVEVGGPVSVPSDLAGFARYDLVVLGDISAAELAPAQLEALRGYVRDLGGGLLLMGGDRAMGPGGYARTPIEDISPVSFDLKQEQRRASLAEVIAVDYSGSMAMSAGGKTKLELANEAAARSADLLGAGDRLGVMHVDTAVSWTVPLAPVADKADIANRIRKVGPGGGGIFIDLSLSAAYDALGREHVQLKHLLLFSDGSDAEERTNAFSLVSAARKRGITTSVVALGTGSDVPALSRMAELGAGRFYLIEDATRLPSVFAQETILASRSAINELNFIPEVAAQGPVLRGIDFNQTPPLTGYVVTIPKARTQVLLRGPEHDPILATWSAGVGRAGAFTSDYENRWGRAWIQWEGAARLFAQVARDLSRRIDDPHVRFETETIGGELLLRATVFDDRGRHESLRRLRAQIAGPDGLSRTLPLEAVGPGSYAAKLPISRPGAYLSTLVDEQHEQALATTGAALSAGEELRPTGTDRSELARIAEISGGRVRDTLAGIFGERETRRFAYDPLSHWLTPLAAALLLLSVGARRLSLPEWHPRRTAASTTPSAHGGTGGRTLGRLRRVKAERSAELAAPERSAEPQLSEPKPERAVQTPVPPIEAKRAPSKPPPPPTAPAAPPGERPKTAAEILLERRRSRSER